jgi:hypothetical protein
MSELTVSMARTGMSRFHCVYQFQGVAEDFFLVGLFTKRDDAEAFKVAGETPDNKLHLVEMSLDDVKAQLLSSRLGALHDVLLRLEQRETRAAVAPPIFADHGAGEQTVTLCGPGDWPAATFKVGGAS